MSLLQMSFSGAVMILAIFIIRLATLHKLPKDAFLILWEISMVRLLVPFSIPCIFSAYSFLTIRNPALGNASQSPAVNLTPATPSIHLTEPIPVAPPTEPANLWIWTWITGVLLCTLYFTVLYIRCRLDFRGSIPIHNEFLDRWVESCPLKRTIAIRQCGHISAPLTYGIFRPVILLPASIDWNNLKQLEYILAHELIHIRKFDAVKKLCSTVVLCIHWFNPLVWCMYYLFNRDMELSCDEHVIRRFGEASKRAYALTLISMEECKSRMMPMCNHFNKTAIEERIRSIMKIKRVSMIAVIAAIGLTVSITTAFATSAPENPPTVSSIPNTAFTEAEYALLTALQFDGYENMTVPNFQNRVWEATDTKGYLNLLERFYFDEQISSMKDSNELASFLHYILIPLSAERWQTRNFNGYVEYILDYGDGAAIEYSMTLSILNANVLTVQDYQNTRLGIQQGLYDYLHQQSIEDLQDRVNMEAAIQKEIDRLTKKWSSDKISVMIEFSFTPITMQETVASSEPEQEPRHVPYGTQEDYHSLFALKTSDYTKQTVAAFNADLLEWANENFDSYQRIQEDTGRQDCQIPLTSAERAFLEITVTASGQENVKLVQSIHTGQPEEDPWMGNFMLDKSDGPYAWSNLFYQFTYHIKNKDTVTIEERDRCLAGVIQGIQEYWDKTSLEDLLKMEKQDILSEMQKIAAQYSSTQITVKIDPSQVAFEKMDERSLIENYYYFRF